MRISDWSSDVCSSDLLAAAFGETGAGAAEPVTPYPFASSEVEMPIVDTCLIGVSTSLDTNGKGNQFNIRTTAETAATPSTTATIVCQTRGDTLPKWRAPMRLPRHIGGNSNPASGETPSRAMSHPHSERRTANAGHERGEG